MHYSVSFIYECLYCTVFVFFRTTSVECCYQNVGIATSVALTMFEGDELSNAMGVPFFYGVVEALILGIYCVGAWKAGWTKAPAKESFWKVIATSYEVTKGGEIDDEVEVVPSEDAKESQTSDGKVVHYYYEMPEKNTQEVEAGKWEV